MTIGLIDVDGHNFPKLVLMKLLAWRRVKGAKQVSASEKQENPYWTGTICWELLERDFSASTVEQIADELYTSPENIRKMMRKIKQETGYAVPFAKK